MAHPAKWRETCDPFSLACHHFETIEILGHPHARNDVFHVRGRWQGEECDAFIKAARHPDSAIDKEVALLSQLDDLRLPRVLDSGSEPIPFSVTKAMPGERLSVLLSDDRGNASRAYLREYGRTLAQLHSLSPDAPPQTDRRFRHQIPDALLEQLGLSHLKPFFAAPPETHTTVFCHGDFHYANVLWQSGHVSAILDLELAGYGDRDFDIAWALFLRPGQRFLNTHEEEELFLQGYLELGRCDPCAVRYYMAQCYVYFLEFRSNGDDYCRYIRAWLNRNCQ